MKSAKTEGFAENRLMLLPNCSPIRRNFHIKNQPLTYQKKCLKKFQYGNTFLKCILERENIKYSFPKTTECIQGIRSTLS